MPSNSDRQAEGLLEEVIGAHGGLDLWKRTEEVSFTGSWGGSAFKLKSRPAVRNVGVTVSTRRQRAAFEPYPSAGHRGVFEDGVPWIETLDGGVVRRRPDARRAFRNARHLLWWDSLDTVYFAGYAIWTYLTAPFAFAGPGYDVRELDPWEEGRETWRRLAVSYPAEVHTHCRDQVFYFDSGGLLRRHDYTAEPFGGWAKAAHYCTDYREFSGLAVPTRRRVLPRKADGRPRGWPLLVWIELEDVSLS